MFLHLCNIYKKKKISEKITFFFVRKSIYLTFFGKSALCLIQKQDEIGINK